MTLGSSGQKIEARNLTKRYGSTVAVDDLSFEVIPGMVTGFIGPNGSGKTTTMRLILGLDGPHQRRGHGRRTALSRSAGTASRSRRAH